MARIGINGFGRIGRMIFRIAFQKNLKVVAINDPFISLENIAYLLKYDSTHGKFPGDVSIEDGNIFVNGQTIKVFTEEEPSKIPWKSSGAKYIVDSSGVFVTAKEATGH